MQKTYWWRISLLIACIIVLAGSYVGPCNFRIGRCLGGNDILLTRTIFHLAISLLFISPFLFFIRDIVFIKWLKFSIAWFALAIIFIALAPVYTGGFIGFGPTKESVSIWMGSLFVIISIIQIVWETLKLKKH